MAKTLLSETRVRQHEHHAHQFAAYHDELHADVNQAKRLVRHLATHGHDACAVAALKALPVEVLERVPHALDYVRGKVGEA